LTRGNPRVEGGLVRFSLHGWDPEGIGSRMENTSEQAKLVEQVAYGKSRRGYGGAIAIAVVLSALVVVAAYYGEELSNYWKLQGWNTGAVRETVERFVREAHDGQPSAAQLLDPKMVQPKIEGGKFVGVIQSGAHGPETTRVQDCVPEGSIKDFAVRIKNRSGLFQADVQYPNGQWARFDVDRVQGALRIHEVSRHLTSTQPAVQPWD
jgi:hypothetical protein